jgi:G:T-mismatch repair DNA endonuclease (very short patch repair protein)
MAKERGGVIDQAAAEALLRRYLDERGWRYEWEQREFGGKRPDAVISVRIGRADSGYRGSRYR